MLFTYVQATGQAFSPQKRTFSTLKNEMKITNLFDIFVGHFCPPGPWIWIQIQVGCTLTFASEAKFEMEAKISFRLEAKKSLISHDTLRC